MVKIQQKQKMTLALVLKSVELDNTQRLFRKAQQYSDMAKICSTFAHSNQFYKQKDLCLLQILSKCHTGAIVPDIDSHDRELLSFRLHTFGRLHTKQKWLNEVACSA
jgi:hypothetical protein